MTATNIGIHRPCPQADTAKTLNSKKLGQVQLDLAKLAADLATILKMPANDAYARYNLRWDPRTGGQWDQTVLGNWSGDATDGNSREYAGHFQWTKEGMKVPYICEVVGTVFRPDHLKSVRIFRAENAIIAAHKDYMEFKDGFRRLHIPLCRSASSMNSEGAIVYQMKVGGIYFLDGHHAHAGGNLSTGEARYHLVLDFDPHISVQDLFFFPEHDMTGGEMDLIERPTLAQADLDKLIDGLAGVITPANYGMIAGLANTLPFTHNFDTANVYDVLVAAAIRSGNPTVVELARDDRKYFLGI